jgi:hypothetical protein
MLLFLASLLAVPLLHTGGLFTTGLAPIADADIPVAQRSVQACAKCHPKQLAEWQHSRHSRAWTNALFQREYKQQPLNWCVHCHAPLQSQFAQVQAHGGPLADEGVSCAVCHLRGGKLLARTRHADSPHDTVASADFGSAEFCAGCHQFNFPLFASNGQVSGYSAFPMQDTVAQFQRGPYYLQGKGRCGDCHAQSPAGHTFPGAHDPQQLKQALSYSLCRTGSGLQLTLTNRGAGHNVPTGDVHRHIVARLVAQQQSRAAVRNKPGPTLRAGRSWRQANDRRHHLGPSAEPHLPSPGPATWGPRKVHLPSPSLASWARATL